MGCGLMVLSGAPLQFLGKGEGLMPQTAITLHKIGVSGHSGVRVHIYLPIYMVVFSGHLNGILH